MDRSLPRKVGRSKTPSTYNQALRIGKSSGILHKGRLRKVLGGLRGLGGSGAGFNWSYFHGPAMGDTVLSFGQTPEDDPTGGSADRGCEAAEKMARRLGLLGAACPARTCREELPRRGSAVKGLTESPFSQWHQRLPELLALARPLLQSRAVQRLACVTFLGILSPRFRDVIDSPLWPEELSDAVEDGSRYDHTLGVALVALDVARTFNFSERGQRYAVAWGLTHDIATWPLSHTSEPALSAITGVSARDLRAEMLLGSAEVPDRYRLAPILWDLGIDPTVLVSLFDRSGIAADEELALLKQVVRSPLTPDSLEGIWRCGLVFGVPVAHPNEVVSALLRHRGVACLDRRRMPTVIDFWLGKSTIYERFINRPDVILWESAWSAALQRCCAGVDLAGSLGLNEDELVNAVKRQGLPPISRVIRYKEPQEYIINGALDALPPEPPVSELWRVLRREPVGTSLE